MDGGQATLQAQLVGQVYSVGPEALPWLTAAVRAYGHEDLRSRFCHWYLRLRSGNVLASQYLLRRECALFNTVSLLARVAPGTPYESEAARGVVAAHARKDRDFTKLRLHALGCFTNAPNEVIPVLLNALTNPITVEESISGLQNFGSLRVPRLYQMALKETGLIRPAELALEHVDKAAYQKLRDEKERLKIR